MSCVDGAPAKRTDLPDAEASFEGPPGRPIRLQPASCASRRVAREQLVLDGMSRMFDKSTRVSSIGSLLSGPRRCPRLSRIGRPAAAAARIRSRSITFWKWWKNGSRFFRSRHS
jgi:hypothetical protein